MMINTVKDIVFESEKMIGAASESGLRSSIRVEQLIVDLENAVSDLKRKYEEVEVLKDNTLKEEKDLCNRLACYLETYLEGSIYCVRRQDRELAKNVKSSLWKEVERKRQKKYIDVDLYKAFLTLAGLHEVFERAEWINFDLTDEERRLLLKLSNS